MVCELDLNRTTTKKKQNKTQKTKNKKTQDKTPPKTKQNPFMANFLSFHFNVNTCPSC